MHWSVGHADIVPEIDIKRCVFAATMTSFQDPLPAYLCIYIYMCVCVQAGAAALVEPREAADGARSNLDRVAMTTFLQRSTGRAGLLQQDFDVQELPRAIAEALRSAQCPFV